MNTEGRTIRKISILFLLILLPIIFLTKGCSCNDEHGYKAADDNARQLTADLGKNPFILKYDTAGNQELTGDYGCATAFLEDTLKGLIISISEAWAEEESGYVDEGKRDARVHSSFTATSETDVNGDADEGLDGSEGSWHYIGHNKATIKGWYNWSEGIIEGTIEITAIGYRESQTVAFSPGGYKVEYNYHYNGPIISKEKIAEPNTIPAPGTSVRLLSKNGTKVLDKHYVWDEGRRTNDDNYNEAAGLYLDFVVAGSSSWTTPGLSRNQYQL